MTWQAYTAISVLGLSVSIILQRVLMHKDKLDPVAYAVFFQGLVGIIISVCLLFNGFSLPNWQHWWWAAIIALLAFGIGHIIYAKTLQRVEASVFSIYFATHAIWVMLLGILLFNEVLTTLQVLGAILIFASVGIVVNHVRHFKFDAGALLGLLTGLLFGIAITSWSYVGRHTDGISWAAASFVGSACVSLAFNPKIVRRMRPLFAPQVISRLALLGLFYAIGSVAMLYAYRTGTLSEVSPLRQTGIVGTVLLALVLLPAERVNISRKIVAAAVCSVGVVLLVA